MMRPPRNISCKTAWVGVGPTRRTGRNGELQTRACKPSNPRRLSTAVGQYQSLTAGEGSARDTSQGRDQGAKEGQVATGRHTQDGARRKDKFDGSRRRQERDG
jgi:hypothetical protein